MPSNVVSLGVQVDSAGAITKIKGVSQAFTGLQTSVKTESDRIGAHFDNVGDRIARRFQKKDIKTLGSSIYSSFMTLFTGGSLADVAGQAGVLMGVSMATQLTVAMAERVAGSAAVQALLAALAPIGAALVTAAGTIGTAVGTAIPTLAAIALAIWPAILVAAIVVGLVYLATHPEVREKIIQFGRDIVAKIQAGLAKLGDMLVGLFRDAFAAVEQWVRASVQRIIDDIMGIVRAVKEALSWLPKLTTGAKLDPNTLLPVPQNAEGGWVGLSGRQLVSVGERGPEYITPNHELGGMGTQFQGSPDYVAVAVSKRDLARMIDEQLYFKLRRAATTGGRV
jgi:phage-related protein